MQEFSAMQMRDSSDETSSTVSSSWSSGSATHSDNNEKDNKVQRKKHPFRARLRKRLGLKHKDGRSCKEKPANLAVTTKQSPAVACGASFGQLPDSDEKIAVSKKQESHKDSDDESVLNGAESEDHAPDQEEQEDEEVAEGRTTFSFNLNRMLELNLRFLFTSVGKENMADDLNRDYTGVLVDQLPETCGESSALDAHLFAANQLLQQFFDLTPEIHQKCPIADMLEEVVFAAIESVLHPHISVLYENREMVSPQEAARLICWIEQELRLAVSSNVPSVNPSVVWEKDCERLLQHYLDTVVREPIKEQLQRALSMQTSEDVREDHTDGKLVTDLPEQVAYVVSQQISAAESRLPHHLLEQVVATCNEELSTFVGDVQLKIGSEWKHMDVGHLCAIVNDANRIAEQVEENNDAYLVQSDSVQEQGSRLVTDVAELALHAIEFLCCRIMEDLSQPGDHAVLTLVGSTGWEMNEEPAVECTVETLKDFFVDLEQWLLSDYYFMKVLKTCLELTIQAYLESFFGNTLSSPGMQDAESAAVRLHQDYLQLAMFFNGPAFDSYHGAGGFCSQQAINDELRILQNMAAILSPGNAPEFVHEDIVAILDRFSSGETKQEGNLMGDAAVLHLVGLRKRHSGHESVMWVKAIAKAKRESFNENKQPSDDQDDYGDGSSTFINTQSASSLSSGRRQETAAAKSCRAIRVPDLRCSKHIHNIRPFRQALDRMISSRSFPYAEPTLQLLETHMPLAQQAKKTVCEQLGVEFTNNGSLIKRAWHFCTSSSSGTSTRSCG